ncbi:hypothetical protein [Saccharothrix texasensis]|uniref:hypothetical protein n=1 Tax=Saccharothrix texasensis TaxID=103734 RepID=UPI000F4B6FEB|nr:hypothetical protein [Saccharothrix texasensis]
MAARTAPVQESAPTPSGTRASRHHQPLRAGRPADATAVSRPVSASRVVLSRLSRRASTTARTWSVSTGYRRGHATTASQP